MNPKDENPKDGRFGEYASPCFAHEVDPTYMGLAARRCSSGSGCALAQGERKR